MGTGFSSYCCSLKWKRCTAEKIPWKYNPLHSRKINKQGHPNFQLVLRQNAGNGKRSVQGTLGRVVGREQGRRLGGDTGAVCRWPVSKENCVLIGWAGVLDQPGRAVRSHWGCSCASFRAGCCLVKWHSRVPGALPILHDKLNQRSPWPPPRHGTRQPPETAVCWSVVKRIKRFWFKALGLRMAVSSSVGTCLANMPRPTGEAAGPKGERRRDVSPPQSECQGRSQVFRGADKAGRTRSFPPSCFSAMFKSLVWWQHLKAEKGKMKTKDSSGNVYTDSCFPSLAFCFTSQIVRTASAAFQLIRVNWRRGDNEVGCFGSTVVS